MSTIVKAVVKAYDSPTHTATVYPIGSMGKALQNVPVANNIASATVVADKHAAVLFFDDSNPADSVMIAVYE